MALQVGKSGRRQLFRQLGADLTNQEWDVMERYYGWDGRTHMTQQEVGYEVGLSQPAVSIVYRRARAKLNGAIARNEANQDRLRTTKELLPQSYANLLQLAETVGVPIDQVASQAAREIERSA
ncbi:MAG TPA: sigma factor-like helix-turn-helix DNA-binding protein [Chloroflexota bacterium]|jgi:hypothetical protein|nr:sigma factor-like helix-turn-helix DNA-binding protein [Chloroflexota bacterium]